MIADDKWYKGLCDRLSNPDVEKTYYGFICTWDLTEEHIRILKDYVDWHHLSFKQYFNIEFLREFKDKIDWGIYADREGISDSIKREFAKEIEEDNII